MTRAQYFEIWDKAGIHQLHEVSDEYIANTTAEKEKEKIAIFEEVFREVFGE